MSDLQLLLDAVLDDPADDVRRLAYADAVQEAGDADLAELVRERVACPACQATGKVWWPFLPEDDSEPSPCSGCGGCGWCVPCQHEGCRRPGRVCEPPHDEDQDRPLDEYYCDEHASAHGYCPGCGDFWGGIGTFEVRGLCDHCYDDSLGEDGEFDDEWDDPDEEYP